MVVLWTALLTGPAPAAGAPAATGAPDPSGGEPPRAASTVALVTGDAAVTDEAGALGDLRRELVAAGFSIVEIPTRGRPWQGALPRLRAAGLRRGLALARPDGGARTEATVFTLAAGDEPAPTVHARVPLGPADADPLQRRRALLALVEWLRLPEPAPVRAIAGPTKPARGQAATGTPTPAPTSPGPPQRPSTTPAPAEERAPVEAAAATSPPRALPRPRALAFGAATTINFDSSAGEPTSHVLFLAVYRLRPQLDLVARARWPIVGATFTPPRSPELRVRAWTFGASAALQLSPAPGDWRLQPFVSVAAGARFALLDVESTLTPESRVSFTPAATLAAQAGARLALAARVHLVAELQVELAQPPDSTLRGSLEHAAAGARTAHAALGVLFDF